MKNGLIFLFCFSFLSAFAQNENFSKNIKLYYNLKYSDFERTYPERNRQISTTSGSNYSIGHFSPAYSYSKNRFFREVELSKLLVGVKDDVSMVEFVDQDIIERTSGERKTTFDIALRLEAGIAPFRENDFFNPVIAFGIQPYFSYGEVFSKTSQTAPVYFRNTGALIQFTPHFQVQASKKLMIDLAPLINLADFGQFYERSENPGLTVDEQIFKDSFFDFLPKRFGIRLGIGYKI